MPVTYSNADVINGVVLSATLLRSDEQWPERRGRWVDDGRQIATARAAVAGQQPNSGGRTNGRTKRRRRRQSDRHSTAETETGGKRWLKLLDLRVKEETNQESNVPPSLDSMFNKLDELLSQTQLYSQFLLEKMEDITLVR